MGEITNAVKENRILILSFKFSIEIIKYTEKLEANRKYSLGNQLFRSGTSVGANIREAQGSESLSDFIHKMKIAYKEAYETQYWLELCKASESYPDAGNLHQQISDILKILGKIISTSLNKKRH